MVPVVPGVEVVAENFVGGRECLYTRVMQKLLDGRIVADAVLATVKEAVQTLSVQGKAVKLVVLVVGEDPPAL